MKNAWSEVDSRLSEQGVWMLEWAVVCFYLPSPPFIKIILAFVGLLVVASRHDQSARQWRPNQLKRQLISGSSGAEFIEYRMLLNQLKRDKPKRNYVAFFIGYWSIVAVMAIQGFKLYLLCNGGEINAFDFAITSPDWFIK